MPDPQEDLSATPLADLVRERPGAKAILESHGIDLCCGGHLTLAQAAHVRGIPLDPVIGALRAPAPGPVRGSDSIRAVLAAHPGTAAVFARHGLLGCGGAAGPDERIDFFAAAHRLDAERLLRDLNEAAARPPEAAPRPVSVGAGLPPPEPQPLFVPFLKAALLSTLTLGAVFGAYNLLVIHWVLGPNPPSHNWVHAGFQVWGFVFLSIAGVSSHTVPRFLGEPLAGARGLRHAWWLTIAAQVLIGWGRLGDLLPGTVAAGVAGPVLQLAAVVLWASALLRTWLRSGAAPERFHLFLAAGTLCWLAAALALVAGGIEGLLEDDAEAAVRWNQAVYALALFGGTLAWIQGFLLRVGPVFLGLRHAPRPWTIASLPLGLLAAAAVSAGSLRLRHPEGLKLMDAGLLAASLSAGIYVLGLRPYSRNPAAPAGPAQQPAFRRWAGVAIGFALLFAVLAAVYAVRSLLGLSAPGILFDAARHAFAAGFVTLLILAFAGRVLPVFLGRDLHRPGLWTAGLGLLAAGVALRMAQVLPPVFHSEAPMVVSGLSGVIAAAGIAAAAVSLWGTMRASPASRPAGAAALGPGMRISALLDAHPRALQILVQAGFTPLANPVMRRMMAPMVTLQQACGMHGIALEPLLERLRAEAGPDSAPASAPVPVQVRFGSSSLLEALRSVEDPELSASIVDLGLVYGVSRNPGGEVQVRMTLADPACPHGEALVDAVRRTLAALPGVERVKVDLVFEPRWTPERATPALRARLGAA